MHEGLDNRPRTTASRISVNVGQDGGYFRGADDRAIQAALDYVSRLGGGTVTVGPGTWTMRCSLFLHARTVLRGHGAATVLRKEPSVTTPVRREADWYESRVAVEDVTGFVAGCGVMLRATVGGRLQVVRDVVTEVSDGELHLSDRLMKNQWMGDEATASTVFPLITAAEETTDVVVEDIVLEGNRDQNAFVDGNHTGGVFIQRCHRWIFRNVVSRNYNGDGFSFQVCDDIRFEACTAEGNANLGFHPGSGSQRPVFLRCTARANSQGIFFCWGVSDGRVERCDCSDNAKYGISIGHRDTDNLILGSTLARNREVGLLFRPAVDLFRGGHRNRIESCTFVDNGFEGHGAAIDVQGETADITILQNRFSDTGEGGQKVAVRVSPRAGTIILEGNSLDGVPDLRCDAGEPDTKGA